MAKFEYILILILFFCMGFNCSEIGLKLVKIFDMNLRTPPNFSKRHATKFLLNLSNNSFNQLRSIINISKKEDVEKITFLDLSFNNLKTIPWYSIIPMNYLEILKINNNEFDEFSFGKFDSIFRGSSIFNSLETINASYCKINYINIETIKNFVSLKTFDLTNNNLRDIDYKILINFAKISPPNGDGIKLYLINNNFEQNKFLSSLRKFYEKFTILNSYSIKKSEIIITKTKFALNYIARKHNMLSIILFGYQSIIFTDLSQLFSKASQFKFFKYQIILQIFYICVYFII
jgi:hypothetical protein